MIAQIIFFLALGLLIVLLIRRAPGGSATLLRQGLAVASSVGRYIAQATKKVRVVLVEFARRAAARRPDRSSVGPKTTFSTAKSSPAGPASFAQFWQEERLEAKQQLMSHYEEGDLLFKEGRLEDAERFFLMAATRAPKDPRVYSKLGLIYLELKNFTDAIEAMKVAVKLDRYNPSRHYNLALSYWGNKDSQRSIVAIREAISLDPVTPRYRQLLDELLNKKL